MTMIPRPEYPRPQFERSEWINLNGEWSCAFDNEKSGNEKEWEKHGSFPLKIQVPFCPESKLSGLAHTDFITAVWYQRSIVIPQEWENRKILLHFGGSDYKTTVYLDGAFAGTHTGGVSPFSVDLTGKVRAGSTHNLVVKAEDDLRNGIQAFGKQAPWLRSKNCNYTRTTGIWQTVWMEAVSPYAVKQCRILPDFDNGAFTFIPSFYQNRRGCELTIRLSENGRATMEKTVKAADGISIRMELDHPRAWEPEDPYLYDVRYLLKDENGNLLDEVSSYAGLRKVHIENGRVFLNNHPIFLRFVLDQGFYEDGLWTAPSDAALKRDIELAKEAGFNGARLHQKIFEERFHYWADRLGYLTWAEFPDWGIAFWQHFRPTPADYQRSFRNYYAEWSSIVERDWNHPSIIAWTPFNETCGYYDLEEHRRIISDIYDLTRRMDPTRPVNDTSGYVHVKTDFWTVHLYQPDPQELLDAVNQQPVFMQQPKEEAPAWNGQPLVVDEYGGVKYIPEGRRPYAENSWGYGKTALSCKEAEERIGLLTQSLLDAERCAGYCYTQLTDIEQEENGIYCYDRTPKFDMEAIRRIFSRRPGWDK